LLDCPHILQHPSADSRGMVDSAPTGRAAASVSVIQALNFPAFRHHTNPGFLL
jgi:hypothetical protein